VFSDSTSYEDFGPIEHTTTLTSFDLDRTFMPSADIDYPHRFKFHGVEIFANGQSKITKRDALTILDLISDVGGLFLVVFLVFYFFTSRYTEMEYLSQASQTYSDKDNMFNRETSWSSKKGQVQKPCCLSLHVFIWCLPKSCLYRPFKNYRKMLEIVK
jgi:hypothetical protein